MSTVLGLSPCWRAPPAPPDPAGSQGSPSQVPQVPRKGLYPQPQGAGGHPGAKGTAPSVLGGLSEQAGVLVSLEVTGLAYTRTAGPEPVVRGTVELQS